MAAGLYLESTEEERNIGSYWGSIILLKINAAKST